MDTVVATVVGVGISVGRHIIEVVNLCILFTLV